MTGQGVAATRPLFRIGGLPLRAAAVRVAQVVLVAPKLSARVSAMGMGR